MKWFFKRLTESSSYAGIGLFGLGGTQLFDGDLQTGIISIVSGLLAFAVGEKGKRR